VRGKYLKLLINSVVFSPPPSPSPVEGGGEFAWDWICFKWFIEMPHLLNVTKIFGDIPARSSDFTRASVRHYLPVSIFFPVMR